MANGWRSRVGKVGTVSSRRNFLRGAAGTLSFAWGGIRLFAGPPMPPETAAQAAPARPFIYGTAFYRPPNPPASMWRDMLQKIAQEYKFNVIRIYPAWSYYNPAPDRFVFDDLEQVMSLCDEFGLRVLMGVVIEEAPYWLERAHPETRFVSATGAPQRLSDSGNNVSGGWPGLCLDWDVVQEAAAKFISKLGIMARTHGSMYAYDCWNEPHIEPAWRRNIWAQPQDLIFCYCDQTIQRFRQWLQHRYGTLDGLNDAWVRHYSDWNEIDPPRAMGTYLDWVDWQRYIVGRSTWEMRFRVDAIRRTDPHHVLESHGGHVPPMDAYSV